MQVELPSRKEGVISMMQEGECRHIGVDGGVQAREGQGEGGALCRRLRGHVNRMAAEAPGMTQQSHQAATLLAAQQQPVHSCCSTLRATHSLTVMSKGGVTL